MLPLASSSRQPGKPRIYFPSSSREPSYSSIGQFLHALRNRSRLTNLAVTLLLTITGASILLNLIFHIGPFSRPTKVYHWSSFALHPARLKGWDDNATPDQLDSGIPLSIETTIERDGRYGLLDHLIMVPGHAIWTGHDPKLIDQNDQWILEPMQKGGSIRTYVKHIKEGVERLQRDPNALLVFSGGATRAPPSPLLPEGISYLNMAHAMDLLPSTPIPTASGETKPALSLNLRATVEEFALDSYENLLFSIARFKEVSGRWPNKITVVGYGMKRRRFEMLHRGAIRFPLDRFEYVGIDDEGDTKEHYAGELKYGFTPFLHSPSGCHPPLSIKRQLRNPFIRYHSYHTSCPEIVELLEWCPPIKMDVNEETAEGLQIFDGNLPWDKTKGGLSWGREGY